MKPSLDRNIVSFSAGSDTDNGSACESCGLPKLTGSLCRACAFRLVDIALSTSSFEESNEAATLSDRTRYQHYEICRTPEGTLWELGRGSMGITYKAVDTHLGCPVALKIINARHVRGIGARDRFILEARTAARLRHPNVASVFHLGMDEDCLFYAMEYIDGETLEAYVRRSGVLLPDAALRVVIQCARALRVAHEQRFIHRDIKPTNIMLVASDSTADGGWSVKVIDFGLVKASGVVPPDDIHARRYFAGTPHYASPEQIASGAVDARSDIYSLGRCFEYMLSGALSVQTSSFDSRVVPPLEFAQYDPLKNIPANISSLLERMIADEPEARSQTAAEVLQGAEACLAALQGDGPLHKSAIAVFAPRRPATIAIGAALVLGIVAGVVKFTTMASHSSKTSEAGVNSDQEARMLFATGDDCSIKGTKADNQHAIELYSKAIALKPGFADAHAALASAYFQNVCRFNAPAQQLDLAIESAQRAIAIDPNSPRGFAALGTIRTMQGRHWEALSEIHHALTLNPRYPKAMRDFSLLWSCVGQPQLGLPWAMEAAKIEPLSTTGWMAAANACVDLCDDDQAERFYRKCLEINPGWVPSHCGLIHLHLLQGGFTQAREDHRVTESIGPGLLLPLTLKAQIDLFSGDYGAAEISYRRLLEMDRNGRVSYFSSISHLSALGFLEYRRGNITEGEAHLSEAAKLHPDNSEGPQGIYDLAAIRAIQNRREDALSLLQQSIASGWMDYRATLLDPRFQTLQGDPRFQSMIELLKGHVTQMRNESVTLCAKPLNLADYPISVPLR